jgi:hypothetical protein
MTTVVIMTYPRRCRHFLTRADPEALIRIFDGER